MCEELSLLKEVRYWFEKLQIYAGIPESALSVKFLGMDVLSRLWQRNIKEIFLEDLLIVLSK